MSITAIVLTYNEELHLARCLDSLVGVADRVYVVDSFSTDSTLQIARDHGAQFIQNPWTTPARQFNWALDHLPLDADWVLRIDADEYLTPELAAEIVRAVPAAPADVRGFYLRRYMCFRGRLLRRGGLFPVQILRLFRTGCARSEDRLMDEHIVLSSGEARVLRGALIDDNHRDLAWWTAKHNAYAAREALEILAQRHRLRPLQDGRAPLHGVAGVKRWIKERIYNRLPGRTAAVLYFLWRYLLQGGFLDGTAGTDFHVLQGFWYRYLVSVRVDEVERYAATHACNMPTAIRAVLGLDSSNT
jgi:glycosyltransferase involved in cell wall biosynthesis